MGKGGALRLLAALGIGGLAMVTASAPGSADGATVTRGDFAAFGAGVGQGIGGHAEMVRRADGTTFVSIHVTGLRPDGQYASHVHKQRCADGLADGHYQRVPGGGTTPPNEIWLGGGNFSANADGIVNERTTADFTAGEDARSVVVHDLSVTVGTNKVACADLS